MHKKIIAFDPGRTTGVAIFNRQPGPNNPYLTIAQIRNLAPVWYLLHREAPELIVYESFLYQRRDKVDLTPVEVIGVIKLYANETGTEIVSQTPAMGKRFWTDDKIKKLDLWEPGAKHAMDALRHLLYYRTFALKEQELLERLKP